MISVLGGLVAIVGVIVGFLDVGAQLGGVTMPVFILAQFIVFGGLAVGLIGIGFALMGLPDQRLEEQPRRRYARPSGWEEEKSNYEQVVLTRRGELRNPDSDERQGIALTSWTNAFPGRGRFTPRARNRL